jgi:general stress protein CsbA
MLSLRVTIVLTIILLAAALSQNLFAESDVITADRQALKEAKRWLLLPRFWRPKSS